MDYRKIAGYLNEYGIKNQRGKTFSNSSVHSVVKRYKQRVDVSIAYPMLSFGYVIVTFLAWMKLDEPISIMKVAALGIIIFGIVLLANS